MEKIDIQAGQSAIGLDWYKSGSIYTDEGESGRK
jgi:hypothetical protein